MTRSEQWVNETGAIVAFTLDPSGRVLFERDALATLLVMAGFAQQHQAIEEVGTIHEQL